MTNQQKSARSKNGKIASVDELLAAKDKGTEPESLYVPEWDVTLKVRGFSHRKAVQLSQEAADEDGILNVDKMTTLLLVHGVAEPELDEESAGKLREKSARAVARVIFQINELNGENEDDRKEAEKSFRIGAGG